MDSARILKIAGVVAVALFVVFEVAVNLRGGHTGSSSAPTNTPPSASPSVSASASPTKHQSGGTSPTRAKAIATLCSASLHASPLIHSVQVRASAGHFGSLGEDAALLGEYATQVQSAATLFQSVGDSKTAASARSLSSGMATISRGATAKSSVIVSQGVATVRAAASGLGSVVAQC
jgi:hypothetical protein